ncbi:MAG TPA: hypothetical protein VIK25_06250 [Gemmatimonadaceae bacterium]
MELNLSSRWTFFYKFILPVLAIGGLCYGAWRAFAHPDEVHVSSGMRPEQAWLIVFALVPVVTALHLWMLAPLKRVVLQGDDLLISNFLVEISVPLSVIESISGPSVTNPKRYTVTFAEPTDFGRRITFLPPMVWSMNSWAEAEEIGEFRSAWAAARDEATSRQR